MALFNYELFAAAFPRARVDLLVDGAPLVPPQNGLYCTWQSQWTMAVPDCADCALDLTKIAGHLRTTFPNRRFGLVSTTNDETIRLYFGYGLADLTPQTTALVEAHYSAEGSRAFLVQGVQHVLLGGIDTVVSPGGVTLRDWVEGFVAGDERWVVVRP